MTARRPMPRRGAGLMQRLRRVSHGDSGMALPLVIALMVVGALLVAGVAATSLSAVGSATSTRASVQAQGVAEAGLAAAQAEISAGRYACTYPDTAGLGYVVQAQFGSGISGAPPCSAPAGAKAAVTAQAAIIVSTATASARGTQGNTSGDTRRVQGVMTLDTTSTSSSPSSSTSTTSPPPTATTAPPSTSPPASSGSFDRAVFVGTGGTTLTNSATIDGGSSTTGGLYVNGTLGCNSSPSINGPTVVWGTLDLQGGGNCAFGNNVTVAGGVNSCNGSTITGILTVRDGGTLSGCSVNGDAYIGGDVTCSGSVSGLLSVQGKVTGNNSCSVGGDLRTVGDIAKGNYHVTGAMISTTGTISEAQGSTGRLTVHHDPAGTGDYQGMTIGGRNCSPTSWWPVVTPGCTWTVSTSSSSPPRSPVSVPTSPATMPVVTDSSFGAVDALWPDFVRSLYAAHGGRTGRFASDSAACSITAPDKVKTTGEGDSLDGPIDAPAATKVVDARGCPNGSMTLRGSRVVLNGDLTILVRDFRSTNGLEVVKGSVAAGVTPVLRIVVPMASSSSSCAAADSAGSITYSNNSKMGSDVSVLFYSAGSATFSNNLEFYGQAYACKMADLKNSFAVHYRPLGPSTGSGSAPVQSPSPSSSPSPSTSSPSGTPTAASTTPSGASTGSGSIGGWTLTDVRDLSSR